MRSGFESWQLRALCARRARASPKIAHLWRHGAHLTNITTTIGGTLYNTTPFSREGWNWAARQRLLLLGRPVAGQLAAMVLTPRQSPRASIRRRPPRTEHSPRASAQSCSDRPWARRARRARWARRARRARWNGPWSLRHYLHLLSCVDFAHEPRDMRDYIRYRTDSPHVHGAAALFSSCELFSM